jgi:hypothetical protein
MVAYASKQAFAAACGNIICEQKKAEVFSGALERSVTETRRARAKTLNRIWPCLYLWGRIQENFWGLSDTIMHDVC